MHINPLNLDSHFLLCCVFRCLSSHSQVDVENSAREVLINVVHRCVKRRRRPFKSSVQWVPWRLFVFQFIHVWPQRWIEWKLWECDTSVRCDAIARCTCIWYIIRISQSTVKHTEKERRKSTYTTILFAVVLFAGINSLNVFYHSSSTRMKNVFGLALPTWFICHNVYIHVLCILHTVWNINGYFDAFGRNAFFFREWKIWARFLFP